MSNPILQALNGNSQKNNLIERLSAVKNLLSTGNPKSVYDNMMQTNPQFRKFVQDNSEKTIEEIALSYDLDINLLKQFL